MSERNDQELNEAVARKLGWLIDKTTDHQPWYGRPNSRPESAMIRELPDFCHSIQAVWEIAEKHPMALVPFSNGHWYATTRDMPETENECFEMWTQTNCATKDKCSCLRCAVADTAPMAICLAFLKL